MRCIIITFIFFSTLFSKDYYEGDHLVKDGVYALYNYEFDRAVTLLTNAREKYPDHPGVHLIWVAARWVRSEANNSFEEANILLETDLILIQPVYEELVERFEYDQTYQLYRGSALGLSARVTLGDKKWLKTFFRAYKGFSIIDDVAKKSPEIMDARLPIGIVEYYSAMSNILIKWAVELYGLDASRDAGLNEMSMAANEGDWAWIEAKGILSFLYLWVEDEPILAFKHSKDLVAHFPKNFYFSNIFILFWKFLFFNFFFTIFILFSKVFISFPKNYFISNIFIFFSRLFFFCKLLFFGFLSEHFDFLKNIGVLGQSNTFV